MSYPKFNRITLSGDELSVTGATGEIDGHLLIEDVTRIDVAIVALSDPNRRVETFLDRKAGDKVIEPWTCNPCKNEIAGLAPLGLHEVVVLVGSAKHTNSAVTSPFLWHGFYWIQLVTDDPDVAEVALAAPAYPGGG